MPQFVMNDLNLLERDNAEQEVSARDLLGNLQGSKPFSDQNGVFKCFECSDSAKLVSKIPASQQTSIITLHVGEWMLIKKFHS